ncbi:glycosyltransferase [uncultured Duncaniella sp.]|uniref:glycosyltransferase n=1 Tax=uncultured Duncaniella sp. TaxID=2768039 RepID=UPI0026765B52|nr:glycosyltransferase [uncultured Duncaniella sp.]
MINPKVSIIVPCYGVEKYLDRCMESLLNQSLQEIEIILVDDGSPDKVPQMCDNYAKQDFRVRVIHKVNGGLGFARNSGLEIATGDYVAFVDSDDYVDTTMYQSLYDEAIKYNADAVFCGFKQEIMTGQWIDSREVDTTAHFQGSELTNFMLDMVASTPNEPIERRYYMSVWHAIYRNKIIQDYSLKFLSEREVVSEDIPFQVDFLKKASKLIYIPQNLYYYCKNSASLSSTYNRAKFNRFKDLYQTLTKKLNGIDGGDQRSGRLFIGYCRTQLNHLMLSSEPRKLNRIKEITNDEIWKYFRQNYPVSNFSRLDHRIVYWLILHKCDILLYLNSKMINLIRCKLFMK